MRKLKIAFLSGGTIRQICPYIEFFKSKGHEVYWFVFEQPIQQLDVKTYDISRGAHGHNPYSKWKYFLAGITLRRILKKIKPDLLHGHYATSSGVISVISGFKPFIVSARGSDLINRFNSKIWRKILQGIFKRAAGINTVSEQLREMVKTFGVSDDKILKLHQGIDLELFDYKPAYEPSKPYRMICTRALHPTYGIDTIIQCCEILKKQGFPFALTLAADGPLKNEFLKIVHRKNLSENIFFKGGYKNEELPQILHNHDLYVSASLWDGTSVSLLEAMACGLFPVVSKIKSNQYLVRENETALMFECGDASHLAKAVIKAINSHKLRKQAIIENRKVVEQKANRENNLTILEDWYYKILDLQ
jgi:glycosyltransferase involved in cell wall biosynthesis